MPPLTDTDNVVLLLSVMNSIEGGKPNWHSVAKELELPTAGAASKRFTRLLAAHNIVSPFSGAGSAATSTGGSKRKSTPTKLKEEADDEDKEEESAPKEKKTKGKAVTKERAAGKKKTAKTENEDE